MMPDWEAIKQSWPVILGVAGLWARLEMALSRSKQSAESNTREIAKMEAKVEMMDRAGHARDVQLATIVATTSAMKETLDRVAQKLEGGK